MSIEASYIVAAVLIGLGATLVMDLWALFLKRVFSIPSLNYCMVGRWLRYMPDGTFKHTSIASAPQKRSECTVGWIAHYAIGAAFALALVILTSAECVNNFETPFAQWKRIDTLQDVLPPRDQGKAENVGGVITNEDYAAKVMAGEG